MRFCTACGKEVEEGDAFCTACGAAVSPPPASPGPGSAGLPAPGLTGPSGSPTPDLAPGPPTPPSSRWRLYGIIIAAVVIVAGGGIGAYLGFHDGGGDGGGGAAGPPPTYSFSTGTAPPPVTLETSTSSSESTSSTELTSSTTTSAGLATTSSSTTNAAQEESEIKQLVADWVSAWESMDIAKYMSFYSGDFYSTDKRMDYFQWRQYKNGIFSSNKYQKVTISGVTVKLNTPTDATVAFAQTFSSDTYSDQGRKTLSLSKKTGKWQITNEVFVKS